MPELHHHRTENNHKERDLWRALMDHDGAIFLYVMDARGSFLIINKSYATFLGLKNPKDATGKKITDLVPAEFKVSAEKAVSEGSEVIRTGLPIIHRESKAKDLKSNEMWQLISRLPVVDDHGKCYAVLSIAEDVTPYKHAQFSLEQERNLFRILLDELPNIIYTKDLKTRYVTLNKSYAEYLGLKNPLDAIGKTIAELVPEDAIENFKKSMIEDKEIINSDNPMINDESLTKDPKGEQRWHLRSKIPIKDEGGEIIGLMATGLDITELKQAEERLQSLSRSIFTAQEHERHRIARDLHDSVNQLLSSIRFRIQSVEKSILQIDQPEVLKQIRMVKDLLERSIQEIRRISNNLMPFELEDLGLEVALCNICNEVMDRTDLEIEINFSGIYKRMPQDVELVLYRIVQEALNNVVKHAEATRVIVRLTRLKDSLKLRIKDNGKGFNCENNRNINIDRHSGMGLLSMNERSALIKGNLAVESSLQNGTEVSVEIPLP